MQFAGRVFIHREAKGSQQGSSYQCQCRYQEGRLQVKACWSSFLPGKE